MFISLVVLPNQLLYWERSSLDDLEIELLYSCFFLALEKWDFQSNAVVTADWLIFPVIWTQSLPNSCRIYGTGMYLMFIVTVWGKLDYINPPRMEDLDLLTISSQHSKDDITLLKAQNFNEMVTNMLACKIFWVLLKCSQNFYRPHQIPAVHLNVWFVVIKTGLLIQTPLKFFEIWYLTILPHWIETRIISEHYGLLMKTPISLKCAGKRGGCQTA